MLGLVADGQDPSGDLGVHGLQPPSSISGKPVTSATSSPPCRISRSSSPSPGWKSAPRRVRQGLRANSTTPGLLGHAEQGALDFRHQQKSAVRKLPFATAVRGRGTEMCDAQRRTRTAIRERSAGALAAAELAARRPGRRPSPGRVSGTVRRAWRGRGQLAEGLDLVAQDVVAEALAFRRDSP